MESTRMFAQYGAHVVEQCAPHARPWRRTRRVWQFREPVMEPQASSDRTVKTIRHYSCLHTELLRRQMKSNKSKGNEKGRKSRLSFQLPPCPNGVTGQSKERAARPTLLLLGTCR